MKMKILNKIAGILAVFVLAVTGLNAQDRNDVIKSYNEGAKAMQDRRKGCNCCF